MNFLSFIVAQVNVSAPEPTKGARFVLTDPLLIIGGAAIIFAVLIFYVAVIRGPKVQGPARRVYKSKDDSDGESSGRRRKRKKTRRREHRGRNPTLAQTGGLPPPQHPTKEAEFFG